MGDKRGDLSVLSDKEVRRLWLRNIEALDNRRRRVGWRDNRHRFGKRLDAEMTKRWLKRQRLKARLKKLSHV